MAGRRPPRGLGPEDRALWEGVARSIRPLHPGRSEPVEPPQAPALPTRRDAEAPSSALTQRILKPQPPSRPDTSVDLRPDVAQHLAAAPLRMDRKRFVALSRGKAEPEARLDLHGMTLAQAHGVLVGFVLRAHAEGRRLVLVITGKGAMGSSDPQAEAAPHGALRPRGELRQQVPQWLAMAPLSGAVLQITPAHRRHGGAGAYYVYLRRNRAATGRND